MRSLQRSDLHEDAQVAAAVAYRFFNWHVGLGCSHDRQLDADVQHRVSYLLRPHALTQGDQ